MLPGAMPAPRKELVVREMVGAVAPVDGARLACEQPETAADDNRWARLREC